MPLSAGTRLGSSYEILSQLGAGGMGEVYRARDSKLGRDVALKVLPAAFANDADRMARFQREAQMLAALNHPNIAAIYGLEESGPIPALIMELVEGPTLGDRIAAGPIPLDEALAIARQIAEALEAAHDKGIIHRDLKPANVKLTPEGKVKVLDFGLAKALETDGRSGDPANSPTLTMAATQAGVILGTASYMSPEQAKGKSVDRRADIWAFGIVLIEMLTARRMYAGETVSETLAAVIMTQPALDDLPPGTPPAVRRMLRRCLDKDPRRRLRDIGEARITLEEVLSGAATEETTAPLPTARPPRRALAPWIAAGILLMATAALGWIHWREVPPAERALRYTIPLPPKSQLHSVAISPDGRFLAMAVRSEGRSQLWLRPLDALDAHPMTGTDGAQYPFWSPDSRFIGFFAQGKLQKIAADGGPALVLCDAPNGRGGAWNRDGVIVFAPAPTGGLQRVQAVGGVPAQVTKANADHRFPILLPDGRHFLFLITMDSADKNGNGLFLGSIDEPKPRRVLADLSSVLFAPPIPGSRLGHVLFLRDDTLMSQPFDIGSLQPAGDLFPVAQKVYFGSNNNFVPASVSGNGVLVYRSGENAPDNQLVWYERSGKVLGPVGPAANMLDAALAPDEKTVAVPKYDLNAKTGDIWLRSLARGTETRFTFQPPINMSPVWSPAGDRIVFTSNRSGSFDLYMKASSGAGQDELLLKSDHWKRGDHWSEDGRFLVYQDVDPKTKCDLWILPNPAGPPEGRKPVAFLRTEFNEELGQISPDGHWIAYISDESGRWEVYVRPFSGGPAESSGKWQVSTDGGEQPRWRHDGKELYYIARDRKMMAVALKTSAGPKLSFEAGAPEALFQTQIALPQGSFRSFHYSVTRDGKRFLIANSAAEQSETPLTVVVNWLGGTKK